MRKKYIFVLLLLFVGFTAHSQVLLSLIFGDKLNSGKVEFGLDMGANWSSISNMDSSNFLRTFNIGFYFDIKMKKEPWHIYTGVLVKANMGLDELTDEDLLFLEIPQQPEDGNYYQRMNYFIVPGTLRYYFPSRFYVEAGPQLALMYKSAVEFYSESDNEEILIKEFNKDAIRKIDAGLTAGLGYKIKPVGGLTLGLRYYYGLTNVYKDRKGTKNSSIFLKANMPVGAGKAKKKREEKEKENDQG